MNADKTILIIEDSDKISGALGEILTLEGYHVEFATNGKEGMDHLITHSLPNLILLDFLMPVMTGMEFRSRQIQIPHFACIPVIVLSADSCVKQMCAPLHLRHFLKKPFEVTELLELIEWIKLHEPAL
ncbi:MAG TPA: response regulator [Bacteriovoracaceae bacterium]|nr:response regulator [Bacteriovoracaceae bacterium]